MKKWMDNQEVCGFSEYPREHFRYIARKDCCLSPGSRTSSSISRKMYKACWNQVITHKKKAMSYDLINRKDPRIDTIFKGLENMERMIDAIRTAPRPAFHGDYFLTDEELSKLLKVSRRTLQEYRTLDMIPYYLVQEKPFTKSQTYKKFLTTHIKDAGKNSDGYEAKVKETASLQGRFFVVGQLVSEFPSPFLDNNLFFVQTKSFGPFRLLSAVSCPRPLSLSVTLA